MLVGIRNLDDREKDQIRAAGVHVFTMKDIDRDGMARVAERAIAAASAGTGGIHVSFDLDACDPSIAPGVGTPVRGGLGYREAHLLMELVADSNLPGRAGPGGGKPHARHSQHDSRTRHGVSAVGVGEEHSVVFGLQSSVLSPSVRNCSSAFLAGLKSEDRRLDESSGYCFGNSRSISSITSFIRLIVRFSGSSVVMSTPASFSRSIGYFEPPEPRNAR